MRSREEILAQFPERDFDGQWEVSADGDSRWRAAVLEVLLDIRQLIVQQVSASGQGASEATLQTASEVALKVASEAISSGNPDPQATPDPQGISASQEISALEGDSSSFKEGPG